MSKQRTTFFRVLYCLIGMALVVYCTYIVYILAMHIWHKEGGHEAAAPLDNLTQEEKLYREMLKGVAKDEADSGYRDISIAYRLYEFHNVDVDAEKDKENLCVFCHGNVPHAKKKEIRAFLNMHAFFLACETCHIKVDEKQFVWYNISTGETKPQIEIESYLGKTMYKLLVLRKEGGTYIPYNTPDMKKFVDEFNSKVLEMSQAAKSAGLKIVHRPMSEKPVTCDNCHTLTADESYIPLKEVGYPEHRIVRIIGNEVVGMIEKYKEFYLPEFLKPFKKEE